MNTKRVIVRKDMLDELLIGTQLMSDSPKPVWEMPWMTRGYSEETVSPTYDSTSILSQRNQRSTRFPWDIPQKNSYNSPSTSTAIDSMVLSQGYEPSARKVKGLMVAADPETVKRQRRKAALEEAQKTDALKIRTIVVGPLDTRHSTSLPPVEYTPSYRDTIPPRVMSPAEMKAIADLFTRKSPVQTSRREEVDVAVAKVHPMNNFSEARQRSKKDMATIAAMFCVETQEQALVRRLNNHVINYDESIGGVKDNITILDVINEENEINVGEVAKIDDKEVEITKEKTQKKKNVFIRFYRFLKRKFNRK